MKRGLKLVLIAVPVVLILLLVTVYLLLNRGVKGAIETFGPQMTQSTVTVESVSVSPFSGSGTVRGFVVGNPQGFKGEKALSLREASLELAVSTALSDPLVIHSIQIDGPELDYETGNGGNLEQIMKNIDAFSGKGAPANTRKYIIKDLRITNAKLRVSSVLTLGNSVPVPIPDIHLTGLGEKSNGETLCEVMKEIMAPVSKNLSGSITALGSVVKDLGEKSVQKGVETGKKGVDTIKGMFGK